MSNTPKETGLTNVEPPVDGPPVLILGRRKVDLGELLPSGTTSIEWGTPMTEEDFRLLEQTVDEYLHRLRERIPLDEHQDTDALIERIAKQVCEDFPFIEQGTGTSTLSKQLQFYLSNENSSKDVQAEHSDCKFPTTVLGLVYNRLKQSLQVEEARLLIREGWTHPHLLLTRLNGDAYLIDFHLQLREEKLAKSRQSWVSVSHYPMDNDLKRRAIERIREITPARPINAESLRLLDENFLND